MADDLAHMLETLRDPVLKVPANPWAMPAAEPRHEVRSYDPAVARPKDPMLPLYESLSPTMGAHGLASLLTEMGLDATHGNTTGLADKLPIALGIFAGVKAKTANLPMLERAQGMAAKGAPREAIWNDTGWFQGPEKKWRFEIDDSGMKHVIPPVDWIPKKADGKPLMAPNLEVAYDKAASQLTPEAPVRVKRLFEHPELEAAYRHGFANSQDHPGITGMTVQLMEGPGSHGFFAGPLPYGIIGLHETLPPGTARSTVLHELQHAVQEHEGFARGSNPSAYPVAKLKEEAFADNSRQIQSLMEKDPAAAEVFRARNRKQAEMRGRQPTEADMAELDRLDADLRRYPIGRQLDHMDWERASQQAMPDTYWQDKARDLYTDTAGEVEARNVQKRMQMPPEQRRATPLWETQDVPDAMQTVTGQHRGGPQLSVGEPPIRAYHWSPAAGDISEANKLRPLTHFGKAEQANERYAKQLSADATDEWKAAHPEHGAVMPVDLHISNPLRIQDHYRHDPEVVSALIDWTRKHGGPDETSRRMVLLNEGPLRAAVNKAPSLEDKARLIDAELKRTGHDGLVYRNLYEGGGDSYIATRSNTVQSALTGKTLFAGAGGLTLAQMLSQPSPTEQANRLAQ